MRENLAESRTSHHDLSSIVGHYEECLKNHGVCAKGVDWPTEQQMYHRYDVMLGAIRGASVQCSLLDIGCGPGLFYDYLVANGLTDHIAYEGIDLSADMIRAAVDRHSAALFRQEDILKDHHPDSSYDYAVLCGVLTEKCSLTQRQMVEFATDIVSEAFRISRVGIVFNTMSAHVDWKRGDLFHWGLEDISTFLCTSLSRHFVIRNDYGLYEHSVYVYKEPCVSL